MTQEPMDQDFEQVLMRWGPAGSTAAMLFGGVPEIHIGEFDNNHVVIMANPEESLATLRHEPDGSLLIETDLPYEMRESLNAAGLAAVLPDGDVARWRVPPEMLDVPIAILRAKRDALYRESGEEFFDREPMED
jgi:hypothetical protein